MLLWEVSIAGREGSYGFFLDDYCIKDPELGSEHQDACYQGQREALAAEAEADQM